MIQLPGLFAGVPWLVHSTPTQFFISILSIPIAKVQHGSESTHEPQTCWKKRLRHTMTLKNNTILPFKK